MDPLAIFDAAYWASKSPAINKGRDLEFDGTAESERWKYYAQLGAIGELVDVPIMIWGWDPYRVMVLRESFGYKFVPSSSGYPMKVSSNPADYPPYAK